jgi:hypothetical protein
MQPDQANQTVEVEDPQRMLSDLTARIITIRDSL